MDTTTCCNAFTNSLQLTISLVLQWISWHSFLGCFNFLTLIVRSIENLTTQCCWPCKQVPEIRKCHVTTRLLIFVFQCPSLKNGFIAYFSALMQQHKIRYIREKQTCPTFGRVIFQTREILVRFHARHICLG